MWCGGGGRVGGKNIYYYPPPTTCHTILGRRDGSLSLSLYLYLYLLSLSLFLFLLIFLFLSLSLSLFLSLYLFISIFSLSLSLYSLYPFFRFVFDGISLSCHHTLLFLSFAHLLTKGWGMARWERVLWTRGWRENDNSWVLEPGWLYRYKVWTQFSTLSTLFLLFFL